MTMTNDEYLAVQMQVAAFDAVLSDVERLPLGAFLERARLADGIGPVLDPTLWREASAQLARIIAVAEALYDAQKRIVRAGARA